MTTAAQKAAVSDIPRERKPAIIPQNCSEVHVIGHSPEEESGDEALMMSANARQAAHASSTEPKGTLIRWPSL